MNDLVIKLGIDQKLLLAQIVNFAILMLVLRKFFYRPILNMLQKRSNIIAKSINEAKKIEEDAKQMELVKEKEMRQARLKANEVIKQATGIAERQKEAILEKTKSESEKMTQEARSIIKAQKEQMFKELEKEVGGLSAAMVEKFFRSGIAKGDQEKIVKNIISSLQ